MDGRVKGRVNRVVLLTLSRILLLVGINPAYERLPASSVTTVAIRRHQVIDAGHHLLVVLTANCVYR